MIEEAPRGCRSEWVPADCRRMFPPTVWASSGSSSSRRRSKMPRLSSGVADYWCLFKMGSFRHLGVACECFRMKGFLA